jgi:hypothetical protein
MLRALLLQLAVLNHLLDVIGHVGAQIVAALRQLTDGQFIGSDIEQDERLDVINVPDALAIKLGFNDIKELTVHPFDQRNSV